MNDFLYLISGITYVVEMSGKYEVNAEITLYDDDLGTSYLYEDNNYSFGGTYNSDELEKDFYFSLGIGFDIPKANLIIHPELLISYNLTPDRDAWEDVDAIDQFVIALTCSVELDPWQE